MHTKHQDYVSARVTDESNALKCVLCPDNFNTRDHLNQHLSAHLDEIKEINLVHLLNRQEVFNCEFSSKVKNLIKNHLIEHVKQILPGDEQDSDNVEDPNIERENKEKENREKVYENIMDIC